MSDEKHALICNLPFYVICLIFLVDLKKKSFLSLVLDSLIMMWFYISFVLLYQSISELKCSFYYLKSSGDPIWMGLTEFFVQAFTRAKSWNWLDWTLVWKLWGRVSFQIHSDCGPNPSPCTCRTELPISLLSVILSYEGCPHSVVCGPLYVQSQHRNIRSLVCLKSLTSSGSWK